MLKLLQTQPGALALERCWGGGFAGTDWQNPLLSVPRRVPVCPVGDASL